MVSPWRADRNGTGNSSRTCRRSSRSAPSRSPGIRYTPAGTFAVYVYRDRKDVYVGCFAEIDDAVAIDLVSWDPAIEVDLGDIAPRLSDAARKRLDMDANGTFTYRPDAVVIATWTSGGKARTEPFAMEVETGYGDQA